MNRPVCVAVIASSVLVLMLVSGCGGAGSSCGTGVFADDPLYLFVREGVPGKGDDGSIVTPAKDDDVIVVPVSGFLGDLYTLPPAGFRLFVGPTVKVC